MRIRIKCMLPCVLAASAGLAQAVDTGLDELSVEQLKGLYLRCSDASTQGRMSTGSIMHCSVAYEALKRRGFGGSFEQLLAWSRAQRPPGSACLSRTPSANAATHDPGQPACR